MDDRIVLVVGYAGVELVDVACVTSAFDLANRLGAKPRYQIELGTVGGAEIDCDSGLRLSPQKALENVATVDTLIISGGRGHEDAAADPALVHHVRRLARSARRVASVCTGTTVLAAAGLLNGKRVTTHWAFADGLAASYPAVKVDPSPIFIRDGGVATSGGVTASLDLTLAFIDDDHGAELARWVAMGMVAYLQRPGNQAQMSVFTSHAHTDDALVRRVVDHVVAHPDGDLRTDTLAALVGVSSRQLSRLFADHLAETPGGTVRRVRLEVAARLASTTDLPLTQVARRSGFGSAESLRQAFVARYGVSPRAFRQLHARSLSHA